MTGNASAAGPGSRPSRAETMPGQRLVNLLVRALLRTPFLNRVVGGRLVILYVAWRMPAWHA